jgi:hypothetical protein
VPDFLGDVVAELEKEDEEQPVVDDAGFEEE